MMPSGNLNRVAPVRSDVSEEHIASTYRWSWYIPPSEDIFHVPTLLTSIIEYWDLQLTASSTATTRSHQ
jgi:hypothetical protein